jgi:hypothetical protein
VRAGSEVHASVVVNVAGPHSSHITKLAFPDPVQSRLRAQTMLRHPVSRACLSYASQHEHRALCAEC